MSDSLTDRIADVITEASQRYFHSIPRGYTQYVAAAVVKELGLRQKLFDIFKGIIDGEWGPYDDDHYWAMVDEELDSWARHE